MTVGVVTVASKSRRVLMSGKEREEVLFAYLILVIVSLKTIRIDPKPTT